MLKKVLLVSLSILVVAGLSGCKKKTAAEMQAEKEKVWRVEQKAKAVKYYDEIVKNYPDSDFSKEAKARLDALGGPPPPAKGGGAKAATAKK